MLALHSQLSRSIPRVIPHNPNLSLREAIACPAFFGGVADEAISVAAAGDCFAAARLAMTHLCVITSTPLLTHIPVCDRL